MTMLMPKPEWYHDEIKKVWPKMAEEDVVAVARSGCNYFDHILGTVPSGEVAIRGRFGRFVQNGHWWSLGNGNGLDRPDLPDPEKFLFRIIARVQEQAQKTGARADWAAFDILWKKAMQ